MLELYATADPYVSWVPPSAPVPGCPPGLENLIPLDYLVVQQQIEVVELMTKYETKNRYYVKNRGGQILFFVQEDSSCCERNCFCFCRPFRMNITDFTQRMVINLHQPTAMFCYKKLYVETPPGYLVGSVQPNCTLNKPSFNLMDSTGKPMYLIEGPSGYVLCGCFKRNVPFKVLELDGVTEVGVISKVWGGIVQEVLTDIDNFSISFPKDLDVRLKAVLLGACLLIDMIYFEDKN